MEGRLEIIMVNEKKGKFFFYDIHNKTTLKPFTVFPRPPGTTPNTWYFKNYC